jgi:hypothetical protein
MDAIVLQLLEKSHFYPLLVATVVVSITLIRSVASVIKSTARERTRREIAAFIAEGSMTPEQGERLMKAGNGPSSC